jgi:hypothetical protein
MLVDGLDELFERYGIPIGLLSKLQVGVCSAPHTAPLHTHESTKARRRVGVLTCIGSRMH